MKVFRWFFLSLLCALPAFADDVTVSNGPGSDNPDYTVRTDDVGGVQIPLHKIDIGGDGVSSPVTLLNPFPVIGNVTITSPVEDSDLIGVDALLTMPKVPIKRATYTTNSAGDASTLNFASHAMQVGDWAYWRVGKEFRQVTARTATQVTVSPPFSSAPGTSASIEYYRTGLPRYVYEAGVSGATGGFLGTGGVYDDGAGSTTWTPFATNSQGYQYVNAQVTSPLSTVYPNHSGVITATSVGEKLIATHALSNASTNTIFVLASGSLAQQVFAGDIVELYVTATGAGMQRTTIGSYAAAGSTQVSTAVADAVYYAPDSTYSMRILRRNGLRTAATTPGSTDDGLVVRNIPSGTQTVSGTVAATQSGTWNIGSITTLPALAAGTANIGDVDVLTLPALPAGTNNIGDVDVLTLPSLPAGTNNIGDVDVLSLPEIPAGNNNIGDVDVLTLPAIPAGNNNIGDVDLASAIPAGNNNIGDVDLASAIPAGNNNIGDVDIASIAAGSALIGDVDFQPRTTGGWSFVHSTDIDSTADSVKGSAGKLGMCYACNTSAAFAYLKSYNLTSVNPASDVPAEVWPIPAASCANVGEAHGAAYSTGIMLRCVTGIANNNTGDPGTNACIATCRYK